jgi:ABC-type branched-subunit amino acid transport system ATPase component
MSSFVLAGPRPPLTALFYWACNQDRTLIVVAQALLAVADRIMVLNFGRKLLEDTPHAAMASREVHEVYMGVMDSHGTA